MATGSSHRGTFVRESGDWSCNQCGEINFKSRDACRRCVTPRHQSEPSNRDSSNNTPQIISKPGDWKCSSCPEINFGSRTVCRSCGTARLSTENTKAKNECVICMENAINTVVTTCGHSSTCIVCGNQVSSCPICRRPYTKEQIIRVFNVHA